MDELLIYYFVVFIYTFVRFKDWLHGESTVGTAVLNGGIGEAPNQNLNVNMPVRSKISTSDGESTLDHEKFKNPPEQVFGFKNKKDRINKKDRFSMIQNLGRRFPLDANKPASIGFSQ